MAGEELPLNAVEHAEEPVGIVCRGIEAMEHFTNLVEDALFRAGLYVTGMVQNSLEGLGEAFAIGGGGRGGDGG